MKQVLITGAGQGIGLATARRFAAAGWHDPVLKAFHSRLKIAGKPHKVAIVAVMSKMITTQPMQSASLPPDRGRDEPGLPRRLHGQNGVMVVAADEAAPTQEE